jgi:ParB family chromosome partitioning protein
LKKSSKFEEIPIDKIEIGKSQARNRKVTEDIDELASSIKKLGLLQPVTVYKLDNGNYELIAGQRRFLAVKQLGWKTITAEVTSQLSDFEAKMLSLSENIVRKEMVDLDTIDAITEAFNKYGTKKAAAEATGLSESTIRKYVKYDGLPEIVQKAVKDQKVDFSAALRASNALNWDGNRPEEAKKVLELAEEFTILSGTEKKQLEEIVKKDPEKPLTELKTEARKPKKKKELKITFFADEYDKLNSYSEAEQSSPEDAAYELIIQGLSNAGY